MFIHKFALDQPLVKIPRIECFDMGHGANAQVLNPDQPPHRHLALAVDVVIIRPTSDVLAGAIVRAKGAFFVDS